MQNVWENVQKIYPEHKAEFAEPEPVHKNLAQVKEEEEYGSDKFLRLGRKGLFPIPEVLDDHSIQSDNFNPISTIPSFTYEVRSIQPNNEKVHEDFFNDH